MKILVTGGLGYIGSHTVVELLNINYDVVIIDDLSNSKIEILYAIEKITGKKPQFEKIDLKDKSQVSDFFKKHGDINGTIHFAASKSVGESVANPLKYYENNVNTLVYLLQEINKLGIHNNFIFSSSCTVYGQSDKMPITEDMGSKSPMSPYGNTKIIGEDIITDASKSYAISAIILRYFNPIGAHDSGLIGELPIGVPQNLIPYITQTAIGLRDELSVYGNDYPTPDGTCIRDYIHVVDLAKAHVLSLKRLLDKKISSNIEIFNLGTGSGKSVLEVINAFERVNNIKVPYKIVNRRDGDVTQAFADTKKANDTLGWYAVHSLDDALSSAWKWQKNIAL